MGRPRAFDEIEILDAAKDTFWELGYTATSIDDLTKRTGLSRSSLYATFGNKDELFTRVLERYCDQQVGATLRELEEGPDGVDAIRRLFAAISAAAADDSSRLGCLAANTLAELGLCGAAQRPLLDEHRSRMIQAFHSALTRAAQAGETEDRELDLRARTLGTLALGLAITLRGNPDPIADTSQTAEAVDDLLRSWTPA